jgi:hypothetical protein
VLRCDDESCFVGEQEGYQVRDLGCRAEAPDGCFAASARIISGGALAIRGVSM